MREFAYVFLIGNAILSLVFYLLSGITLAEYLQIETMACAGFGIMKVIENGKS